VVYVLAMRGLFSALGMLLAGLIGLVSLVSPGSAPAVTPPPPSAADALRRPLHLPKLKRGARCPLSPSRLWSPTTGQRLNGRGPAFLVATEAATVRMNFAYSDEQGWYAQKTPWVIGREYGGALLVRGARIDRRGQVRFARGYGEHLRELYWDAGADQSLTPDPAYRFLASATLVRARGCYAFQVDGESFSRLIVVRVRG
jgi:hypothetical protein